MVWQTSGIMDLQLLCGWEMGCILKNTHLFQVQVKYLSWWQGGYLSCFTCSGSSHTYCPTAHLASTRSHSLKQCCPEIWPQQWKCSISVLSSMVVTGYMWLAGLWYVACGTEDLKFSFYSVSVNLNSYVQLGAPVQCSPKVSFWTTNHTVVLLREAKLSSGRENTSKKMLLAPPEISRAKNGRCFLWGEPLPSLSLSSFYTQLTATHPTSL